MLGQKNGLGLWKSLRDFAGSVKTIKHGHADIHDDHVGPECLRLLHRLAAIGGFTNHQQAFALEQRPKALADEHVIIGQHYANGHLGPIWRLGATSEW